MRILGEILSVGLFFLGLIVCYAQLEIESHQYTIWLWLIGISLCLPLIITLIFKKRTNSKLQLQKEEEKRSLRANSQQIEIDLSKAKIKSNSWTDKIITDDSKYAGLNDLTGNAQKTYKEVQQFKSIIQFEITLDGEKKLIEVSSNLPETNLLLHFAKQGKTTFYYFKNKPEKSILDLDFLIGSD